MFRSLKQSLNSFFEKEKINPAYKTGLIINIWDSIVGSTVSKNTTVVKLQNNIITIKTTTPVWKNELLFQKQEIINKLNSKQKTIIVKDIKFI